MYKKNIIIIVTLAGLFFSLNVNAQEVSTAGYQKGLETNVYNMTGARPYSSAPQSTIPSRSFVDGVPPFTSSPFRLDSELSDARNTNTTAKGWNGFIRTNTAGIHLFVLKASGLSETSRCLATIEIDGRAQSTTKFDQNTSESAKFRVNLKRGMRPVNMWLHCDEGDVSSALNIVNLELKRSVPGRNRDLVAIDADDFYSKIPDNNS